MRSIIQEGSMAHAVKEIEWKRDFDTELKAAAGAGQHVLLDFSAAPL